MKIIGQLAAGGLITFGTLFIAAGVYTPFDSQIDPQERMSPALAYILFGTPFVGAGSWLIRELEKQQQKEAKDYLQSTFYQLLQQNNGKMTVFQFAMEAKLTAETAKQYLDERAKEYDADFQVSDDGIIFYHFPFTSNNPYFLPSVSITPRNLTYEIVDVILEAVPADQKIATIQEIRLITGWDLRQAKEFVEAVPNFFLGVSKTKAKAIKHQLEKVGAKVSIR